jgi:hypothetical protein
VTLKANRLRRPHLIFELARLDLFLTVDAVWRPRQSFQPFIADGAPALEALPVRAILKALEREADESQLAVAFGTLAEQHLFLIGEDSLVGDIEGVFCDGLTALFDGGQHGALKLALMTAKMFFESEKFVVGLAGHDATAPSGYDERQAL